MKDEFDFEGEWTPDEEADRRVWLKICSKRRERTKRRRIKWFVCAACSALAAVLAVTGALFFFSEGEETKRYAQEELRASPVEWDFFSAACGERGFYLPDSENYFIDFVSATAFYLEDELYAFEAKYDYNWGVGVRLYLTDKENLEVEFFAEEITIGLWKIGKVEIFYQLRSNKYYCAFSIENKRYYLTMKGSEPDVVNVLQSIFGQKDE